MSLWRSSFSGALAALLISSAAAVDSARAERGVGSKVRSDERVVFFPTAAYPDPEGGGFVVPIHGWIFEPEEGSIKRSVLVDRVRDYLDVKEEAKAARILDRRARLFLVDNERGKRMAIRLGGRAYELGESREDGHFFGELKFTEKQAARFLERGWVRYQSANPASGGRRFGGEVRFQRPAGVSVVSDIDDTIKISNVRDRDALIRATFLEPFRPVPGMARVYRRWAKRGAVFHYLSASPWPLYSPLRRFLDREKFPRGAYHLRPFRLRPSAIQELMDGSEEFKREAVARLMRAHPKRSFVLVGDSGEKDPEVYGEIYRRFGGRILRIYIRDVTGEGRGAKRYRRAFRGVPGSCWKLFREPEEIPAS